MVRKLILFIVCVFLSLCLSRAEGRKIHFIYCSDVHYGLEREFRGSVVTADSVSRAMLAAFLMLEDTRLPEDGGVSGGEVFGRPDFVICTGDIANRMEDGVQTAAESWEQFCRDWSVLAPDGMVQAGGNADDAGGGNNVTMGLGGYRCPLYLVPGNHDISNAIGYTKRMEPGRDPASAAGIYNLMMRPDTLLVPEDFDYSEDKTHYCFTMDSIRFVFMGMWPDSSMREWYENDVVPSGGGEGGAGPDGEGVDEDGDIPAIVFTHDPPEAEAKHFTNPRGDHDINERDGFQNLLSDICSVRYTDRKPKKNWRELERFFFSHPEIRAYFHGDCNYNEFYTWEGTDGSIALPVFRVDSPMKGEFSSTDETLLSFMVVTIDTRDGLLTARECLWNTGLCLGIEWGESRTIRLHIFPTILLPREQL